jgi:hypothetical protein
MDHGVGDQLVLSFTTPNQSHLRVALFISEVPMFKKIKKMFEKPSATQLAFQELEEAERQMMAQLSAAEYHAQLAAYYRNKVTRLRAYVGMSGVSNGEKMWATVPQSR